jgi:hypothetical protein
MRASNNLVYWKSWILRIWHDLTFSRFFLPIGKRILFGAANNQTGQGTAWLSHARLKNFPLLGFWN